MWFSFRHKVFLSLIAIVAASYFLPRIFGGDEDWTLWGGLPAMAGGLAITWFLSGWISRNSSLPSEEIESAAEDWAKGNLDRKARLPSQGAGARLGSVLNRMAGELRERFHEVEEDRERLSAILSSMTEGVLVLDHRGTILLINSVLGKMFLVEEKNSLGRSYLEVRRHHSLTDLIKTVLDGREARGREILIQSPVERHYQVQSSITEGGHAVFVFHDITALKELERARKDFVANVSHEIRTPLTSIKGYIEALRDGVKKDPKKMDEFLEVIQKNADHLDAILSDLLELSSIESGRYLWKKDLVSAGEVVAEAVRLVRPLAEKKGQTIEAGQLKKPISVLGDRSKLVEVFSNLLDNAVKYTPEGGRISVDVRNDRSGIEMQVADTGIGISRTDLSRLFERFYRVDKARSREIGGTGLGLSIVKHIVEAHGGTVSVKSKPGEGSRFRVILPKVK